MTDTTQDRINDLLLEWDELHRQGKNVVVEELCRDCPELVDDLRRRIKAIKATEWLEESLDEEEDQSDRRSPADFGLPLHLGRYRLDDLIGEGGYGQVWKGHDPELNRAVAIKVPHQDRIGEAEQFLAEARRVAQLSHPDIVPVHDVGKEGDVCYIVTALVEGHSLADVIAQRKISADESARIVADVAAALHHAHAQGFVHRDVKPGNIILDQAGYPHLADFGIAVSTEDEAAATSVGTLAYLSPERVSESGHDVRSDIYSLGVVLHELLTGRRPIVADNPGELRKQILSGFSPRFDSSVPQSLQRICRKCLAADPAERFAIAEELEKELRRCLEPRRTRLPLLLAFMLVVVLACGIVLWLASGTSISGEEAQANAAIAEMVLNRHGTVQLDGIDEVIDEASDLPNIPFRIVEVSFREREVEADNLEGLAAIPSLTSLNLTLTNVTNDDLELVGRLRPLKELRLNQTAVTDDGLPHLSTLDGLELLEVRDAAVTDGGMEAIGKLTGLRRIVLVGTKITDEGLGKLAALKHLREARLGRTAVTNEGIRQLRVALPECQIVR